jgi:demethoxyubiquinone hydroxylase (CLK1/Coq7/Cat5 family)
MSKKPITVFANIVLVCSKGFKQKLPVGLLMDKKQLGCLTEVERKRKKHLGGQYKRRTARERARATSEKQSMKCSSRNRGGGV